MKLQIVSADKGQRTSLLTLALLCLVLAPLHAASLYDGFGPLLLVDGADPVRGGCGRSIQACTCCVQTMKEQAVKDAMTSIAGMGGMAGMNAPVIESNVRLGGGIEFDASPNMLTVTNVGMTAYSINSVNNPILTFVRGQTYTFSVTANGHPFYIKTVQGAGTGNAFTEGVTGSGTQTGTVTFTVPMDAPDTLFYDCANHAAMTNRIDVIPEPSALNVVALLGSLLLVARYWKRGKTVS